MYKTTIFSGGYWSLYIPKRSFLLLLFLALLLTTYPSHTARVHAEEDLVHFKNTFVDLENQRVWGEGKGDDTNGAPNARNAISIERSKIDYQSHTIDWKVTFTLYKYSGWLRQWKVGLFLPSMDYSNPAIPKARYEAGKTIENQDRNHIYLSSNAPNSLTVEGVKDEPLSRILVERENQAYPYKKNEDRYISINKFRTGTDWREGALYGEKLMGDHYWNHIQEMINGSQSGSDMNTWMNDEKLFGSYVASFESRNSTPLVWRITTYHSEGTVLEDVPLIAFMSNRQSSGYKRFEAIGPFGIAHWHKIKKPNTIYADDIESLTSSDQQRIFATVDERSQQWLNALTENDNPSRARKEEADALPSIDENKSQYIKTFSDGSKLRIPLNHFVRQRELTLITPNQANAYTWTESVQIGLGVNDPDFKTKHILVPTDGNLPAGLYWDQSSKKEYPYHGEILGAPRIDWSKVPGTDGHKEVSLTFHVALRKEDGSINMRSETYKPVTILIRQDEGAVPVGVADFHSKPFSLLLLLSLAGIATWLLRCRQETEHSHSSF